jgi:hypothetical protein
MESEEYDIQATITFRSTFSVNASSEEEATEKLKNVLNAVDLFEVVEGKSEKFTAACGENDVWGAPQNEYDYDL